MKHLFPVVCFSTIAALFFLARFSQPVWAVEAGAPLFVDSFETAATFAENWKFSGKVLSADGRVSLSGGDLIPRQPLPAEFVLECDVALFHDLSQPGGFAGIGLDGFHFKVKPEGKSFLVWKEIGAEQASGNYPIIDGFQLGKPVHLRISRTVRGNLATYDYCVNGQQVGTFKAKAKADNGDDILPKMSFNIHRVDRMDVDNFRLFSVKKSADESPNLVINSSFEVLQEGLPLYLCRNGGLNLSEVLNSSYEAFLDTVQPDAQEKRSGQYSLRCVNNNLTDGQAFFFHSAGTVEGQPGVFSIWLKSDCDDLVVCIRYGKESKYVHVTRDWQRYEVVNPELPKPFVYSFVQVHLPRENKGTLWMDDAQAELLDVKPTPEEIASGKTFASPYKASELDKTLLVSAQKPDDSTVAVQMAAGEKPPVLPARTPVSILSRLSFYMNEPSAVFRISVDLPEISDVSKLTAVLETAGQTVQSPAAKRFQIAVPLKEVKPGMYDVRVSLKNDAGETVVSAVSQLTKREYRAHATQINHFSRSVTVDGKPYFQFAPFLQINERQNNFADNLTLFHRYGFKGMHVLFAPGNPGSVSIAKTYMDSAAEKDMKTLLWLSTNPCDLDVYAESVKKVGDKNVVSYQTMDEPELWTTPEFTIDYLRAHRPLFPYHPMHMNNTRIGIPANFANLETDILMLDDYLTNQPCRTIFSVVRYADMMRQIGEKEGKPVFFFVVGGNFPLHFREPTYGEQIAQCYGCVAAGCNGLTFFYGLPKTPGNWKACVQLARESAELNDVLTSEEDCSEAQSNGVPGLLLVRAEKKDQYVYLITCNIDSESAGEITFTLPAEFQYEGNAEVLFENRALPIRNGNICDQFDGWSRHVYKIRCNNLQNIEN